MGALSDLCSQLPLALAGRQTEGPRAVKACTFVPLLHPVGVVKLLALTPGSFVPLLGEFPLFQPPLPPQTSLM